MIFDVVWRTQISASDPMEAAQKALELQHDPQSIETIFAVQLTASLANDAYRATDAGGEQVLARKVYYIDAGVGINLTH